MPPKDNDPTQSVDENTNKEVIIDDKATPETNDKNTATDTADSEHTQNATIENADSLSPAATTTENPTNTAVDQSTAPEQTDTTPVKASNTTSSVSKTSTPKSTNNRKKPKTDTDNISKTTEEPYTEKVSIENTVAPIDDEIEFFEVEIKNMGNRKIFEPFSRTLIQPGTSATVMCTTQADLAQVKSNIEQFKALGRNVTFV